MIHIDCYHMVCCVDETFMSVDTDDFSWFLKTINILSAITFTFCVVLIFAYLGFQINKASEVEVNEKKKNVQGIVSNATNPILKKCIIVGMTPTLLA